jgi:hypothetical protein
MRYIYSHRTGDSYHTAQVLTGWICLHREGVSNTLKVRKSVLDRPSKCGPTCRQNHDLVEPIVYPSGRLVDRAQDDDSFFFGDPNNLLHDILGRGSVQP